MKYILKQNKFGSHQLIYNINRLGAEALGSPEAVARREQLALQRQVLEPEMRNLSSMVAEAKTGGLRNQADEEMFRGLMQQYFPGRGITARGRINNRLIRIYEQNFGVVNAEASPTANRDEAPVEAGNRNIAPTQAEVRTLAERSSAEIRELQSDAQMAEMFAEYEAGKRDPHFIGDFQVGLTALGFDTNGVEGIAGPGTRRAVRQYENAVNTGASTAPVQSSQERITLSDLREYLNTATVRLNNGEALSRTEMKQVQSYLTALASNTGNLSFDPKGIDGIPGEDTSSAITAYVSRYQPFLNNPQVPWMTGVYR
jgi:hypothetical protein